MIHTFLVERMRMKEITPTFSHYLCFFKKKGVTTIWEEEGRREPSAEENLTGVRNVKIKPP